MKAHLVICDKVGTVISVNEEAGRLFGYSPQALLGRPVTCLMSSAVGKQHGGFMFRFFQSKGTFRQSASRVVLALRSDGTTVKIRIRLSLLPFERVAALIEPVMDRGFAVVADTQGRVVSIEGDVKDMLGITPEALIRKHVSVFCRGNVSSFAVGDRVVTELRRNDGQTMEAEAERVAHAGPHWKCWFREVDFSLEVLVTVREGIITSASLSCLNVLGFEPEALVGRPVLELIPRFSSEEGNRIIYCRSKSGAMFYVSVDVTKEESAASDGKPTWVAVLRRHAKKARGANSKVFPLGWYDLVEEGALGEGSSGRVSLAVHRLTNMNVAVKTILRSECEKQMMEFPPTEISLLKALNHKHICQLYHVIFTAEAVHLVLERGDMDLLDYSLEKGALPEAEVSFFFRQMLRAVAYMHGRGIVHRDLKLENILLVGRQIKLIDFGLGDFYDPSGTVLMERFLGSPDYAAPELLERRAYFGPALDVWAMGVVLFVLATNYLPFHNPQSIVECRYKTGSLEPFSQSFHDLLAAIFRPAQSRITVKGICDHPWIQETFGEEEDDTEEHSEMRAAADDCDLRVGKKMEEFGFSLAEVKQALRDNQHNQITATYHLLSKRMKLEA